MKILHTPAISIEIHPQIYANHPKTLPYQPSQNREFALKSQRPLPGCAAAPSGSASGSGVAIKLPPHPPRANALCNCRATLAATGGTRARTCARGIPRLCKRRRRVARRYSIGACDSPQGRAFYIHTRGTACSGRAASVKGDLSNDAFLTKHRACVASVWVRLGGLEGGGSRTGGKDGRVCAIGLLVDCAWLLSYWLEVSLSGGMRREFWMNCNCLKIRDGCTSMCISF